MSDSPRGWTLTAYANGPSLTLPGLFGTAHVLDSFTAKVINGNAGANFTGLVQLSSPTTFTPPMPIGVLEAPASSAGNLPTDEASEQGLDLAAQPGEPITVSVSAATGATVLLVIQGHDI